MCALADSVCASLDNSDAGHFMSVLSLADACLRNKRLSCDAPWRNQPPLASDFDSMPRPRQVLRSPIESRSAFKEPLTEGT